MTPRSQRYYITVSGGTKKKPNPGGEHRNSFGIGLVPEQRAETGFLEVAAGAERFMHPALVHDCERDAIGERNPRTRRGRHLWVNEFPTSITTYSVVTTGARSTRVQATARSWS